MVGMAAFLILIAFALWVYSVLPVEEWVYIRVLQSPEWLEAQYEKIFRELDAEETSLLDAKVRLRGLLEEWDSTWDMYLEQGRVEDMLQNVDAAIQRVRTEKDRLERQRRLAVTLAGINIKDVASLRKEVRRTHRSAQRAIRQARVALELVKEGY